MSAQTDKLRSLHNYNPYALIGAAGWDTWDLSMSYDGHPGRARGPLAPDLVGASQGPAGSSPMITGRQVPMLSAVTAGGVTWSLCQYPKGDLFIVGAVTAGGHPADVGSVFFFDLSWDGSGVRFCLSNGDWGGLDEFMKTDGGRLDWVNHGPATYGHVDYYVPAGIVTALYHLFAMARAAEAGAGNE